MSEIIKGSLGFKGQKGDTGEIGTPVPYLGTFEELKNSNMDKLHNYIILDSSDTEYVQHWVYYDRYSSIWKDGGLYLSYQLTTEMQNWINRQSILEQKYNEQIKNIASTEPQNAEIVDARMGFDTLGDIIKRKVYYFSNVEEMKDCLTLFPRRCC